MESTIIYLFSYFLINTLISKISDINDFIKPNDLVAFFDTNNFVNELDKSKGNKNKISKYITI